MSQIDLDFEGKFPGGDAIILQRIYKMLYKKEAICINILEFNSLLTKKSRAEHLIQKGNLAIVRWGHMHI